jgi:GH15 family glucan-1,4-alpha-glucosidase
VPHIGAAAPSFHPIASYGFLSDCRTSALVAPDGAAEWLCLPRFDSPSVFGAILDRTAGAFRFGPKGVRVPVAVRYVPGTNVLETTWMTEGGDWLVIHEALAIAAEGEPEGMLIRHAT